MDLYEEFNDLATSLLIRHTSEPKLPQLVTSRKTLFTPSTKQIEVIRTPFKLPKSPPSVFTSSYNNSEPTTDYTGSTAPGSGRAAGDSGSSHYSTTVTNPYAGAATVVIEGFVDDAISVNGIEESLNGWTWYGTQFDASQLNPFPSVETAIYTGAHGFSYTFTIPEGETLVIAEINNFDHTATLNITITMTVLGNGMMGTLRREIYE